MHLKKLKLKLVIATNLNQGRTEEDLNAKWFSIIHKCNVKGAHFVAIPKALAASSDKSLS